ncbi:MAG: OmpH family outer membrane protein [Fluviicola sp.]|jgi:outer membrane protein
MNRLIFPLIVLFVAVACGEKKPEKKEEQAPNVPIVKTDGLKIAYYYSDSLRTGFDYYKSQDERITAKGKNLEQTLMNRQKAIIDMEQRFQNHIKNGTASGEELQKMENELLRKKEQLMQYQQQEGAKLEKETADVLTAISKKIEAAGKKYCEKYKIDMLLIHGAGGQINYINGQMDVTKSFIDFLNNEQELLKKDMGE